MFYSKAMNRGLEQILHFYISSIYLFFDNDHGTIISQAFFKLVLPNILLNTNVLKVISH
jgi:hypothetical protein